MSRDRATDILDVLSVTGGVPRYLEEVNPALSAARVANPCKMGLSWGLSPGFSQDFRHSSSTVWISRADVVKAKDYCGKVVHEANAKKLA